ncbi:MAG: hypothetical protein ACYC0B_01975 [Gemmatimonadaceae bacterium]
MPKATVGLSLMQPWAWLCLRPDVTEPFARAVLVLKGEIKDVENRTWRTYHRGPLLIHASKRLDKHGYRWVQEHFPQIPLPRMNDLQLGGIVGRVTVRDCVRGHPSRWAAVDQWNWVLVDQRVRVLSVPRTGETVAAANERLRGVLMEEVGICFGTRLLLRMIETVPVITVRGLAREYGVPCASLASAFHRAGVGATKEIRYAILLYRLRCVMSLPGIRRVDAAVAVECSSTQSMGRFLQVALGRGVRLGQWCERTTPATVLADWRTLLSARSNAIRSVLQPQPSKERRAVRLEWLRSEVAERERRIEAMRHEIERLERAS